MSRASTCSLATFALHHSQRPSCRKRLTVRHYIAKLSAKFPDSVSSRSSPAAEEKLQKLLSLDDRALRQIVRDEKTMISLEFLLWLKNREEHTAASDEKSKLNQLGGKLIALKEGLDPEAAADLLNSAKEIQEGETSKPSLSLLEEQGHSLEVQIQHRKAELARRRASDALSTMQLTKGHEQAASLLEELQARRALSTAEIIGRAPLREGAAQKGLDAAMAADRILQALLSVSDREKRLALVPEAFIPPAEPNPKKALDAEQEEEEEEELLHTTPLRLLQAISLAMQRIEGTQPNYEGDLLLAIPNGLSKEELREALTDIKKAVFAAWDEI